MAHLDVDPPAATDPSSDPAGFRWQVHARWAVVLCLAAFAILAQVRHLLVSTWPLLAVCGFMGAYNLVLQFSKLLESQPARATFVCLLLDIFGLTVFLELSGDMENPLFFAYSLPVVAGSVLLSKRVGFALATVALLLFTGMMALILVDAIQMLDHHHLALLKGWDIKPHIDPDETNEGWDYIATQMFSLIAILYGSAFGFGKLAERLREKTTQLQHENERLLVLLSILPEGVVLLRKDGSILLANPAARQVLPDIQKGSLLQSNAGAEVLEHFSRFAGPVEEFEAHHGDRILAHAFGCGSPNSPIVWVVRDLTQQHRLMGQVMHHSKMIDLGLLAAGIAHEIGNPLSSMSAIVEILETKRNAELMGPLRSLRTHVDRIDRIVRDITGYAKPSAGQRSRISAETLVDKALQIFRLHEKSRGLEVIRSPRISAVEVEAVEDQIVQVLLNLLLNAADASSGQGTISIGVERASEEALFTITDHGVGMSEETQRRIFTPFFSTKGQGKGVGLGLFVSESIIRAHGGRIDVKSASGEGSTFAVALPLPRALLQPVGEAR